MAVNVFCRITLRQTTFWDFLCAEGVSRVHFKGKREFRVAEDDVASFEVLSDHPLLGHYTEGHTAIYVAGASLQPDHALAELEEAVLSATAGWRYTEPYLNAASLAVLTSGYGMLFSGPESIGKLVGAVLAKLEVEFTVLPAGGAPKPMQLLLAGGNFVIASEFRIEKLPSTTSLERTREG
jgi:hypothetical protein